VDASVDLTAEQAGGFENTQVLRDRGQGNVERFGKFGNRGFTLGQPGENGAACGIGKGAKSGIEGRIVNHMV
jgi:hypothetical protein